VTITAAYVAYGSKAITEAEISIKTLRRHNKGLPIAIINDVGTNLPGTSSIVFADDSRGARWAKLNVDKLIDADNIIYIDADTRIKQSLQPAIDMLNDYDLVIAASVNQNGRAMQHIQPDERGTTLQEIGNPFPLQLQAGFMLFNRRRCAELFEAWRQEWQRWRDQDQAALLRALYRNPVKTWLLGYDWNSAGGKIIDHQFGRARV